jgi:hypothetical protein
MPVRSTREINSGWEIFKERSSTVFTPRGANRAVTILTGDPSLTFLLPFRENPPHFPIAERLGEIANTLIIEMSADGSSRVRVVK